MNFEEKTRATLTQLGGAKQVRDALAAATAASEIRVADQDGHLLATLTPTDHPAFDQVRDAVGRGLTAQLRELRKALKRTLDELDEELEP